MAPSSNLNKNTPNNERPDHPYPPKAAKSNWPLVVILSLIALAIGLFAGRLWGEKQATDSAQGNEKSASSEISSMMGFSDEDEEASDQKPVLTVETVQPERSILNNDITAEGTISPETTSSINGKVSGVAIERVLVEEGDRVKEGQVLAVFDTDAMQQRIVQSRAELAESQSNYNLAKRNAERVLPLVKIDAISQQEADRYRAEAEQAATAVAAAKARLNNQELDYKNAKVVAPVDGIISEKTAHVGNVPGGEPLFTIIEEGKLEWRAQLDPNKVGAINVGTPVEVSLPNNKTVKGRVSRIAPTAEDGSRQITVYASLQNSPEARPGMYQPGTFKLGTDNKITIPVSAVVVEDGYDYVMQVKAVKDENRKTIYRISQVKVKLGERQGDRVVLLEPLAGDGNIVRQGGSFLTDGDLVQIADIKNSDATKPALAISDTDKP